MRLRAAFKARSKDRSLRQLLPWNAFPVGAAAGCDLLRSNPDRVLLVCTASTETKDSTGLVLAPASCQLFADVMLGRAPIIDPAPYAPAGRI
jgi:hypothetical protein